MSRAPCTPAARPAGRLPASLLVAGVALLVALPAPARPTGAAAERGRYLIGFGLGAGRIFHDIAGAGLPGRSDRRTDLVRQVRMGGFLRPDLALSLAGESLPEGLHLTGLEVAWYPRGGPLFLRGMVGLLDLDGDPAADDCLELTESGGEALAAGIGWDLPVAWRGPGRSTLAIGLLLDLRALDYRTEREGERAARYARSGWDASLTAQATLYLGRAEARGRAGSDPGAEGVDGARARPSLHSPFLSIGLGPARTDLEIHDAAGATPRYREPGLAGSFAAGYRWPHVGLGLEFMGWTRDGQLSRADVSTRGLELSLHPWQTGPFLVLGLVGRPRIDLDYDAGPCGTPRDEVRQGRLLGLGWERRLGTGLAAALSLESRHYRSDVRVPGDDGPLQVLDAHVDIVSLQLRLTWYPTDRDR